jgi:hypothetical protein
MTLCAPPLAPPPLLLLLRLSGTSPARLEGPVEDLELLEVDRLSPLSLHRPEHGLDLVFCGHHHPGGMVSVFCLSEGDNRESARAEASDHQLQLVQPDGSRAVEVKQVEVEPDDLPLLLALLILRLISRHRHSDRGEGIEELLVGCVPEDNHGD